LVKYELVTGSTVVSGSKEDPKWDVFPWGEVVGTMKKTSLLDDSDDERATKEDTISVDECESE